MDNLNCWSHNLLINLHKILSIVLEKKMILITFVVNFSTWHPGTVYDPQVYAQPNMTRHHHNMQIEVFHLLLY